MEYKIPTNTPFSIEVTDKVPLDFLSYLAKPLVSVLLLVDGKITVSKEIAHRILESVKSLQLEGLNDKWFEDLWLAFVGFILSEKPNQTEVDTPFHFQITAGPRLVHFCVVPVSEDKPMHTLLKDSRELMGRWLEQHPPRAIFVDTGVQLNRLLPVVDAMISAFAVSNLPLKPLKQKSDAQPKPIERCLFVTAPERVIDVRKTVKKAHNGGVLTSMVRHLAYLPSNVLTAENYIDFVKDECKKRHLECEFFDTEVLKTWGCGAFLSVVQAKEDQTAGILKATWKPTQPQGKISLVGKGVLFDTGGVNTKTASGMLGMQGDMQGSAVALATFFQLAEEQFPCEIDLYLALGENHTGPKAYKPTDVVKAKDGTTIEIIHTDAEGRMMLADTLLVATDHKPHLVMDFATLTGSCVTALGNSINGVFLTQEEWLSDVIQIGKTSGERAWVLPSLPDYTEALKSKIADTKQCLTGSMADHGHAAVFLQRFVQGVPHVHVDLSASEHDSGVAHCPGPFTGNGVRFAVAFLEHWNTHLKKK